MSAELICFNPECRKRFAIDEVIYQCHFTELFRSPVLNRVWHPQNSGIKPQRLRLQGRGILEFRGYQKHTGHALFVDFI